MRASLQGVRADVYMQNQNGNLPKQWRRRNPERWKPFLSVCGDTTIRNHTLCAYRVRARPDKEVRWQNPSERLTRRDGAQNIKVAQTCLRARIFARSAAISTTPNSSDLQL